MRDVSLLAENVGDAKNSEWLTKLEIYNDFIGSEDCFFVHSSIPRDRALTLGVKPLLEAVVKEIEDNTFLCGTPYGQHEDLCDRLNGILRKYPPDVSIFQEFIQNADDAKATELMFILDHRTTFPDGRLVCSNRKWKSLQHTPALCIYNNRKFTEADIDGIAKLGKGGKDRAPELIGKFGIGFNVAYHITDCPSFVSYSEDRNPEYFCVFDPTRKFLPISKTDLPGKKCNFKEKAHFSGFPDQFKPYLVDDLPNLLQNIPKSFQDQKHGCVIFRLPLTRYKNSERRQVISSLSKTESVLDSGHDFSPSELSNLLKTFAYESRDMLLFLNHLRCISVFEILGNGTCMHHFTTTASIPESYHSTFEQYSRSLKQCIQMIESRGTMRPVPLTHQMTITHMVSNHKEQYCTRQKSQWLVQRVIGGTEMTPELLQAGLNQGLQPVGGVATLLKTIPTYDYRLFCFLPLPIQSELPVHVNGHFLVDDSRKHLETIKHHGLAEWNHSLAQNVIVPAYIDLIRTAKCLLFNRSYDYSDCEHFYHLFPHWPTDSTSDDGTNVGELNNLKIVYYFYKELLRQNPSIIVQKLSSPNPVLKWTSIKSCLFCTAFFYGNTILSVNRRVCAVLLSLGLTIADAPNFVYEGCSNVDPSFRESARVDPRKIAQHLRNITCTNEQKELIKSNIEAFLTYCVVGYEANDILPLFNDTLYLLACDGTLQHGKLFKSKFSGLLPHCAHKIVDPKLENTEVGKMLHKHKVIVPLSLAFVAKNINLPTGICSNLDDRKSSTVKLLWECIADQCVAGKTDKVLKKHFHSKAIIPTAGGKLYPVFMSKVLVRVVNDCDQCSVMRKLDYPQIDFNQIGFKDDDSVVHRNIIDLLTSCFQDGQDIVDCFLLYPPKNLDIDLTDGEAQSFSNSLIKVSKHNLHPVLKYLLQMPLFHTIGGSRISLHGVTKVFILTQIDFPLQGIPATYKGKVVLNATNAIIRKFYNDAIPDHMSAHVNLEQFYMQFVLPILPELNEDDVKRHVKYIGINNDQDMNEVFLQLKKVAFIRNHDQFHLVKDLCDPKESFYNMFYPDSVLPAPWCDESTISILKSLGLRSRVTVTEWLESAKRFVETSVSSSSCHDQSRMLLDKLIEMISCDRTEITHLLKTIADIEFIYCPQEWQLIKILSLAPSQLTDCKSNFMVKLRGSVPFHKANVACLCKSVLPKACEPLLNHRTLGIEVPVSPKTVAKNLKRLCSHLTVTCARSLDKPFEQVKVLADIIEQHYEYLSSTSAPSYILDELKNMMCILLPSNPLLLQFVKPSQLVVHLPSDCTLEPYCYRVPPSLNKYMEFLTVLGVKQELKAIDYGKILKSVQTVLEEGSSINSKENEVIKSAYFEIVRCLRRGDCDIGDVDSLPLPDQKMKLTHVHNLCFNDAPWYEDRLPELKMILQPPVDDRGNYSLPKELKVRLLSELVTEKLMDSCKSPDVVCNAEELFADGKRPESKRCIFVQKILATLKSKEFFHGLCRMYYTEHHVTPSETFILSIQSLKTVKVNCITKIKTVLCVDGKLNPSTEDTNKLCYVCAEDTSIVLYIAPHDAQEEDLLSDLAFCIRKLVDSEIHDQVPIAAAFACEPCDIPQALNRHSVSQYTPHNHQQVKPITIGTPVSWNKLDHRDSLIVLNFEPEDSVRYICDDGSLVNAEVVSCKLFSHPVKHLTDLLERTVTIKIRDDDSEDSEYNKDQRNDDSSISDNKTPQDSNTGMCSVDKVHNGGVSCENENGVNDDPAVKVVSPLHIFKLLTIHQKKSLWGESTSQYARPVVLASVPFTDFSTLEQWLSTIYNSALFKDSTNSVLKVLTLRLLGHIHYLLVFRKKAPLLFKKAALKIHEIIDKHGLADDRVQHECDKLQHVVTEMRESLMFEGDGNNYGSNEHGSGDELKPFREKCDTFSGEAMIKIIDRTSVQPATGGGNKSRKADVHTYISPLASNAKPSHANATQSVPPPSVHSVVAAPSTTTVGTAVQSTSQHGVQSTAVTLPSANVLSRFTATTRKQRRRQQPTTSRFQPVSHPSPGAYVPPPPKTCMRSATVWLEQAKADFKAAGHLLKCQISTAGSSDESAASTSQNEVEFPALVCFLCHDTVEKCLKGVLYAYCGLSQHLVNCGSLVTLINCLESSPSPHCPDQPLFDTIKSCVMSINRHENKSRFPNYQTPHCAPAAVYNTEDAEEAFFAVKKLIEQLKSEDKFSQVLGDLEQMPMKRFISTLRSMPASQDYPSEWNIMGDKQERNLFLLDPEAETEEYDFVTCAFTQTLPDAKILRVQRVQNKVIWQRYLHCSMMMSQVEHPVLGEQLLFHGTKRNNPELIYEGTEGFDMRFSAHGMWGRGNYFAVNASYSHSYAFDTGEGNHKMFAAWVLTGRSYNMKKKTDHSLTKPPFLKEHDHSDTSVHRRYDSVCGETSCGTRVYITYDNMHAYPAYIITYYRN